MKKNIILPALITTFLIFSTTTLYANEDNGSTFSEVWAVVISDPYENPQYKVTLQSFYSQKVNQLLEASIRTIEDDRDILPCFDKLLHPNGACLSGTWNITEDNPYSGYFKKGSQGLIIVRTSVALSETTKGHYRGFGMAGKIYPTTDPDHADELKTANFFAIDDFGGTLAEHYTDVGLTNQPELKYHPGIMFLLPIGLAAGIALGTADEKPGIRQLYPISELGLLDQSLAKTPEWMKIQAPPDQVKIDEKDFRDELNVDNYPNGQLFFDIFVSTEESTAEKKEWIKIGFILLDDFVVSNSCDHRLHFQHPKFR
jgi:hypothetical protein